MLNFSLFSVMFVTVRHTTKKTLLIRKTYKTKSRCLCFDVTVIGGGIIGTSIARTIKQKLKPSKVAILEKENCLAKHQSSCNSNVIHAGIYYKPDSLKAKMCVKGLDMVYKYCALKNIPINKCGKLIIAQSTLDVCRLKHLHKQSLENGIDDVELLQDWKRVEKIQPYCKGLQALWSPRTGNVNWKTVTQALGNDFENEGGEIFLGCEVKSVAENLNTETHPIKIELVSQSFCSKYVIICTGLNSGSLLSCDSDENSNFKHMSLRVNYSLLNPTLSNFIKTNVYAMPVVGMPFLGCHISPTVDGNILLGPSAVPAFKPEGYKNSEIDPDYVKNLLKFPGFRLMVIKNFWVNFNQFLQTSCADALTLELQKYFPMISTSDILKGPSAVQAQLIDDNGDFVEDFLIDMFMGEGIGKRIVNCRFLPSPGATSALAIADMVGDELARVYDRE